MISLSYLSILCLTLTLILYLLFLRIYRKWSKPWLNPLYTVTLTLLIFASLCHIHSNAFQQGNAVVNAFLQLTIVALAVPIYKHLSLLKKDFKKIIGGVAAGTAFGIGSVITLAHLFNIQTNLLASLIPKTVTLPIALTVSGDLGGLASTTILFVVISGLVSLIIGPRLLNRFGIKSKAAKGLAMGTSAQMLGAHHSLNWGEEEGAMGSVAMTTTALLFSLLVPILPFLLKIY
ncbi:LrgB family protein [Pullulanibacillus sp. KACC 23026]|uniref:LrgB family protein n=1 Tax=Pullulanibacillus sp. KACC 23026 TaxID=3028315 RepID=UPI0023AF7433|nr:LrgB family protein [Pullulanibacillus sp. KACC 23026]WEG12978.1 LrgB family protein [Pullulanibacillus sp. KACC 23026]